MEARRGYECDPNVRTGGGQPTQNQDEPRTPEPRGAAQREERKTNTGTQDRATAREPPTSPVYARSNEARTLEVNRRIQGLRRTPDPVPPPLTIGETTANQDTTPDRPTRPTVSQPGRGCKRRGNFDLCGVYHSVCVYAYLSRGTSHTTGSVCGVSSSAEYRWRFWATQKRPSATDIPYVASDRRNSCHGSSTFLHLLGLGRSTQHVRLPFNLLNLCEPTIHPQRHLRAVK